METDERKYRILLLGDFSNLHSQLGKTLTEMGHDVTVISDGCGFQQTARTHDISRKPGKLNGALLAAKFAWPLHKHLKGYDIVAVTGPYFAGLREQRLRWVFERLRGENERIFTTFCSTDPVYINECLGNDSLLRYNEYRIGDKPSPLALSPQARLNEWLTPTMVDYTDFFYDNLDGAVSVLYEYDLVARHRLGDDKVEYAGIPIDVNAIEPYSMNFNDGKVRLFLGRHAHRIVEKGTDILEKAARAVCGRNPGKAELVIVENRPYDEYVKLMRDSHIILDQLYSYTPATNAMIAMAHQLVTVSGGEPEYYDFIGERTNKPIINADPEDFDGLVARLDSFVRDPQSLIDYGARGRQFVESHNEARLVAQRFLDAWTKRL